MKNFDFNLSLENVDKGILDTIADIKDTPKGAYNIRKNGEGIVRHSTDNITIEPKTDNPGIDITVKPGTRGESVHIPVIITKTGLEDLVYNDFYIGDGAQVEIIAGCAIHNCGGQRSQHDGIHSFHIGKNASLKYIEKHYGQGEGTGEKVLNPTTVIDVGENSYCEMETIQIEGVDSTKRETKATVQSGGKLVIIEKLMTHDKQIAHSYMDVYLDGEDSSTQIISRSVGKDDSQQMFYPKAIGNNLSRAHIQCDSIIMDNAKISSIPAIEANHPDAMIIHEAAIGKINSDQLVKLQTFGMDEEKAEEIIVQGFLK
jgi:Fe-S cluster assembly scaffold protein SufB